MKIKGHYKIKMGNKLLLESNNLVLTQGLSFIAKKLTNNTVDEIKSFALGTGSTNPQVNDSSLENETATNEISDVTIKNNMITFIGHPSAGILSNTSEIGLKTNKGLLITRNVHEPLTIPLSSQLTIEYTLSIISGESE